MYIYMSSGTETNEGSKTKTSIGRSAKRTVARILDTTGETVEGWVKRRVVL
jgi:hypothetical protein